MIKNRERKMFEFITVRELYELYINDRDQLDGIEYVELQGWIRTNRNSGKVGFLALNDGTYFKNVQVVYLDEIIDNYEETSHISTGSAVKVTGKLKLTPEYINWIEESTENYSKKFYFAVVPIYYDSINNKYLLDFGSKYDGIEIKYHYDEEKKLVYMYAR